MVYWGLFKAQKYSSLTLSSSPNTDLYIKCITSSKTHRTAPSSYIFSRINLFLRISVVRDFLYEFMFAFPSHTGWVLILSLFIDRCWGFESSVMIKRTYAYIVWYQTWEENISCSEAFTNYFNLYSYCYSSLGLPFSLKRIVFALSEIMRIHKRSLFSLIQTLIELSL